MPVEPAEALIRLTSTAAVAGKLRELRAAAGSPSYAEITRRVVRLRQARGLPDGDAYVGRVTVYDCFRDDRKRFDSGLVLDIARALGASPGELRAWRGALGRLQQQLQGANLVRISDRLAAVTPKFVGREMEIATLVDATAPVWISGMPGIGKSQLVHRAAAQLSSTGVVTRLLVADLRGHSPEGPPADASALLDGLLRVGGVQSRGKQWDAATKRALLAKWLEQPGTLMILDDAADTRQVDGVLGDARAGRVWVTSRAAPEGAYAERFVGLPLGLFDEDESTQLLAAHVGRDAVERERSAAAEVAESAGHLPLALDIAASRVASHPDWSLQDHVERIRARHEALRLSQPVQHTFSLSYQALPSDAQVMLRLIAINPLAHIDHTSALALAGGVVTDPDSALELLANRHMLTRPGPGWYGIHQLLRLHIADISLDEDPPRWRADARRRLVRSVITRAWAAYRARTEAMGEIPRTPSPELELELPTMELAEAEAFFRDHTDLLLHIAHEPRLQPEGEYPVVVAISETLTAWLDHLGRFDDARRLHSAALEAAEKLGDDDARTRALVDLGMRLTAVGRYDDAEPCLVEAVTLVAGRPREGVSAFNALGIIHDRRGRTQEAEEHFHRSAELAESLGDTRRHGHALSNLAGLYNRLGRTADADDAIQRSTALARAAGDHMSVARGLVNRSSIKLSLDDPHAARSMAREALELFEEAGQVPGVVVCCSNIASALAAIGEHQQSLEWAERGLALCRKIGMRQHETTLHARIARARLSLGHSSAAREAATTSLEVARDVGEPHAEATALLALGDCLDAESDHEEAVERWHEALRIFEDLEAPEADEVRARLDAGA